jgi:hypothetical protein
LSGVDPRYLFRAEAARAISVPDDPSACCARSRVRQSSRLWRYSRPRQCARRRRSSSDRSPTSLVGAS